MKILINNKEEIRNRILDDIEKNNPAMAGEFAEQSLEFIVNELSYEDGVSIEEILTKYQ